jgi:hypothetical protein
MKPHDKDTLFHRDPERALEGVKEYALRYPVSASGRGLNQGVYAIADDVAEAFTYELVDLLDAVPSLVDRVTNVLVEGEPEFSLSWHADRKDPRVGALHVYDAVRGVTDRVTAPKGFTVDTTTIQRFRSRIDGCGSHATNKGPCDICAPRSVVLVFVNAPLPSIRERVIVVDCETQTE